MTVVVADDMFRCAVGSEFPVDASREGAGKTAETQRHAFEPLFTTKKNGTGLGLPLVHQDVARQGGEIVIDTAPGAGTSFTSSCRRVKDGTASAGRVAAMPANRRRHRNVLLVEDATVAAGIASLLQIEGLQVESVLSGTEAIHSIRVQPPDVVVLDVGLPDMDGMAVYDAIAATHPDLPGIFSTGHTDQSVLRNI